ncbi:MAG: acetyltransferase [Thermosynechococcaceae cyanobacterium MS004]|nr:acetyltransferase [Thermosynechococcaceae cyanobacterium MS004]
MLLQKKDNGTLVEIVDIQEIISPNQSEVMGRVQAGEEEQDPERIQKQSLIFPSGESLPRCWIDADYQK